MAGMFDLELHDAPDPEFISDDEGPTADLDTTLNVTEIEVGVVCLLIYIFNRLKILLITPLVTLKLKVNSWFQVIDKHETIWMITFVISKLLI